MILHPRLLFLTKNQNDCLLIALLLQPHVITPLKPQISLIEER